LDSLLWRGTAAGYHLCNLACHLAATLALYWLAWQILSDFGVPCAGAGACLASLLFATHPALVEASAWVENRAVLLCAGLCMCAYGLLLRFWTARGGWPTYAAALALYGLALLTQEAAVGLPLTLALHALLRPRGGSRGRHLRDALPFFAAAFLFAVLRVSVLKSGVLMVSDTPDIPFTHRALAVVRTLGGYVATLLLPVRLSVDRYFVIPRNLHYPGMMGATAALAAWVLCLAALCRRWRLWGFGLASVLLALLPVANIVLIPGRPLADQRLYLPALGLCVCAGGALGQCLRSRRRATVWLLVALTCIFALRATDRVFDFRDEYAFWREAVRTSPAKGRARMNLGMEAQSRLLNQRAEKLHRAVVRMYPRRGPAHHQLGQLLLLKGQFEAALAVLERAGELPGATPQVFINAAVACHSLKRYDDALAYIDRAKAMPGAPSDAWYFASRIYRARGQDDLADANLREAKRRLADESADALGDLLW